MPRAGIPRHMTNPDPTLDDVITPEHDKGVPHDRTLPGGSPQMADGLMEHQADLDRRAAGLSDDADDADTPAAEE